MKQKPSINPFLPVFILINIAVISYSQSRTQEFPRLEPDPKALEFYNLSHPAGRLSWQQLAQMGLWASGDTSASYLGMISSAVTAVNSSPELPSSEKEKAEFILSYMHKNILKSYSLYQTRVDTIFANGRFNCVSSAVLYMILCKSSGINTSGVMTKEHAFVIVHTPGRDFDVETTNPYGFDPGNRKEFLDSSGNITGFAYVPPQNYRDRQTISQTELVSLILNNRIAELERHKNYHESVPVAVDMAALLKGKEFFANDGKTWGPIFEDPRNNVMDRLLNFGNTFISSGREEESLRWADTARALYPDPRWQDLIHPAVNNYLFKLMKADKTEEARSFLEKQKHLLSATEYNKQDALIVDTEIIKASNKIKTAEDGNMVVLIIDKARKEGKLTDKRANELLTPAFQRIASVLCAPPANDWRAAIAYMESIIALYGANRDLEQHLRIYRGNLSGEYHNRFAAEWNRKNFEEAERIINEGLAEFPNDRQLLADRETINRNRRR